MPITPDAATLFTYATVVLGLFPIPGPAVLLTLARATVGGRRVANSNRKNEAHRHKTSLQRQFSGNFNS